MQAAGSPKHRSTQDFVELVRQIRLNDEAATAELYRIVDGACRYALARDVGPEDFEDRLHDVFLDVLHAIQKPKCGINDPRVLIAFIRRIRDRNVFATYESRTRDRKHTVALDGFVDPRTKLLIAHTKLLIDNRGFANPDQMLAESERVAFRDAVLAQLTPKRRQVLRMFYVENKTKEQIQQEMKLNENQFRLLKSRALERFGIEGRRLRRAQLLKLKLKRA